MFVYNLKTERKCFICLCNGTSASCICVFCSYVRLFLSQMYRYFHHYCLVRSFQLSLLLMFVAFVNVLCVLFVICFCLFVSFICPSPFCTRVLYQISILLGHAKKLNPIFICCDKEKKKCNGQSIILFKGKNDFVNWMKKMCEEFYAFLECTNKVLNICLAKINKLLALMFAEDKFQKKNFRV